MRCWPMITPALGARLLVDERDHEDRVARQGGRILRLHRARDRAGAPTAKAAGRRSPATTDRTTSGACIRRTGKSPVTRAGSAGVYPEAFGPTSTHRGDARPARTIAGHADLPRPRRDDAAPPRGPRGDAAVPRRGRSATRRRRIASGGARAGRARRGPRADRRGAIGAEPREIVFTSGGTEANNLALKGAAWAGKARGHRIVTSAVEHHAVGHTLAHLEKFGFEIVELPVDRYGRVDPDRGRGRDHRRDDPRLDHAREQRGRHDPADRRRSRELVRAQAQGRACSTSTPCRPRRGVDSTSTRSAPTCCSIAAHKLDGPKGVGALYVRHGTHILAQQHGGAQERYRRAGTENVAGAVGHGRAPTSSRARSGRRRVARVRRLRERLRTAVLAVDGVELTGHPRSGCRNLLSVIARDADGASVRRHARPRGHRRVGRLGLHDRLDRGRHVLTAMGYPDDEARGSLRLSLGRTTTDAEIDEAVARSSRGSLAPAARRGRAAVLARPARPGGRADEPDPRRDVGRRRLVGRGGAAPRAGPRGRRRLDAPPRRRRHVLRVQEELLLARRRRRRPPRRRPSSASRST